MPITIDQRLQFRDLTPRDREARAKDEPDLVLEREAGWNGMATMLRDGQVILDGLDRVIRPMDIRERWIIKRYAHPRNDEHLDDVRLARKSRFVRRSGREARPLPWYLND